MKSVILRGVVIVAALVTAVACGTADSVAVTTAPVSANHSVAATAGRSPVMRTVDQYVWLSCANGGDGETVHVTGDIRYDVQLIQDSTGTYHLSIKSNTAGLTAVGLTTGTFFRGSMAEHINSRADDYLTSDNRSTDIIRFTAPGSRDAYALMVTSHFIVDDGTYVLWDQTWNEVCR